MTTLAEKPTRINKALVIARMISGDTQRVAAERIRVSAATLSKAERGLEKFTAEQADGYYRSLGAPESGGSALLFDKKGLAKGMIAESFIKSVRADKNNPNVMITTSVFQLPGRKGQPAKKVSWVTRVAKATSPAAYRLAKEWSKDAAAA